MNILIGGAWPYANGSLHLGHITSLLPGDILARYFRMKGEDVLYVSGSDCNGTPITIRAKQEGISPTEIADRYHNEFLVSFQKLGFTYDLYTRTDDSYHHQEVQQIFLNLMNNGHIYKKVVDQSYCLVDEQFLPDRYVEGICPVCGEKARGDQCDACSTILDPLDLKQPICKLCGSTPEIRQTEHFYFALSKFQQELERYWQRADTEKNWRDNALKLTKRYLDEGLVDRAASRDLELGVPIPLKGFEKKKIYVWIEAVSGYLTASKKWALDNNVAWNKFWNHESRAYYVHGKDNIPFHTIIWPAILLGLKELHLPDHIISSEYMTLEKKKLSTSKNWAVWVPDLLERYHPDSIRYFLTVNAPEKRDTDFSWREFIYSHNSELLGAYGNLVNRTFQFIFKSFNGKINSSFKKQPILENLKEIYDEVGKLIEAGEVKQGLERIFQLVREANKYFDDHKPWIQVKEDTENCQQTLYTCTILIANLANLLEPYLPFSSQEIKAMLNITEANWDVIDIEFIDIKEVKILFERIDLDRIDEERNKLGIDNS